MNHDANKQFFYVQIVSALIGIILGLLLILLDGDILANIFFAIIGIVIILLNIHPFIQSIKDLKYKTKVAYTNFISYLILIVIAIVFIFYHNAFFWAIGLLLLVFSIYKIIIAKEYWKDELIHQLPSIIISLIILIVGIGGLVEIIISIIGWIVLVIASLYLILTLFSMFKRN